MAQWPVVGLFITAACLATTHIETARAQEGVMLKGAHARLVARSDRGDWVGLGRNYSYATPRYRVGASYYRGAVWIRMGTFEMFLTAPSDRLHVRRYNVAPNGDNWHRYPDLNILGNGHGCNSVRGAFTVHRLSLSHGQLRRFSVSFVQHCEGNVPALRGRFSFRR
jgi:hypothetical protein